MPLVESRGFSFDIDTFAGALSPKTKLVILNSPGNPTGSVYSRDELRALAEVALEEGILMLSDEIYEKITYDHTEFVSLAALGKEMYDLTITVNGFSKAYSMTGWRLGWLVLPPALVPAVEKLAFLS